MMARVVSVLLLASCGRVAFDERVIADATDATAAPVCDPGVDFQRDSANCGTCGHDCLGGICEQAKCQPVRLDTSSNELRSIFLDETHIYFAGIGAIGRVPKAGGPVETVATFTGTAFRMTEHGGYLYFAVPDVQVVARTPISSIDAAAEIIDSGAGPLSGIVSDGAYAYWATTDPAGRIRRTQIGTGTRSDVTPTNVGMMHGLRLVGSTIYFLNESVGLERIDTNGGNRALVAPVGTFEVEIDGNDAFTTSLTRDEIVHVSLSDGAVTRLAAADGPWGLAFDATHIYVANEQGGWIGRVSRAGGTQEVLATLADPVGIAVDEKAIYYTARYGGIYKLAK